MARLAPRSHPDFERRENESFDAHLARTQALLQAMQARSDALPEDEFEGALLKFPVADGYAYYEVVRAKPLTLRHVDFCDGYHVPPALIRGLRVADVYEKLAYARAMRSVFARHDAARAQTTVVHKR